MRKYKSYKQYRERFLFLCRDWGVAPTEYYIKDAWKWFNKCGFNIQSN